MGGTGSGERERFLDVLRTVAVLRVIVWHAFGAAAITYVFSAVPAMFFVTGSLLARSLDRHGAARTVTDRLRRMLVPLWAFTAVAFAVMAIAQRLHPSAITKVPAGMLLWWLVPLRDPTGSAWEAGWLSSPLWYLRALLWMIVAAPLLLRLVREAPRATFAALVATILALDLAARHPDWPLQQTRVPWLVGDFALYATFVGLGFLHRDGHLARVPRRAWALAALAAGGAATAWVLTQPVHRNVVNDSHPMHLLVGFAWLAAALAMAAQVERLAARPRLATFVRTMNTRSMSVYLWHTSAIIVAYQLLWRIPFALPHGLFGAALLALTALGTVTLVTAFGWIEDVAAQRRGAVLPGPLAAHPRGAGSVAFAGAAMFALVGLGAGTLAPLESAAETSARRPPAPSQQPPIPVATAPSSTGPEASTRLEASTVAASRDTTTGLTDAVDTVVARWLATTGVSGAQIAVMKSGAIVYAAATGTNAGGSPMFLTDTFDSWSITKTYTAWLVYQLVQSGELALDAPIPSLSLLPQLDTSTLTVRRLLDHSTGLVPYRDTKAYLTDPARFTDAVTSMQAVLTEPVLFAAGTKHVYSSSNYLVLGLLLEQVTGRSFDALLRDRILDRYGLDHTVHAPPAPGNPNFSTGGVITDIVDMVTWAHLYLAAHAGLDAASYAAMNVLDGASAMGAGTIGYCPCSTDATGATRFTAIGYAGATTEIQYAAFDGTVIAVNLSGSVWDPASRYAEVVDLFTALRTVVDAQLSGG